MPRSRSRYRGSVLYEAAAVDAVKRRTDLASRRQRQRPRQVARSRSSSESARPVGRRRRTRAARGPDPAFDCRRARRRGGRRFRMASTRSAARNRGIGPRRRTERRCGRRRSSPNRRQSSTLTLRSPAARASSCGGTSPWRRKSSVTGNQLARDGDALGDLAPDAVGLDTPSRRAASDDARGSETAPSSPSVNADRRRAAVMVRSEPGRRQRPPVSPRGALEVCMPHLVCGTQTIGLRTASRRQIAHEVACQRACRQRPPPMRPRHPTGRPHRHTATRSSRPA